MRARRCYPVSRRGQYLLYLTLAVTFVPLIMGDFHRLARQCATDKNGFTLMTGNASPFGRQGLYGQLPWRFFTRFLGRFTLPRTRGFENSRHGYAPLLNIKQTG